MHFRIYKFYKPSDYQQCTCAPQPMLKLDLVDKCCETIHILLAMMQSMLCAYNSSSQLVSSIKGTFIESPNARKVMQVSMVNLFWLNSMETQGFSSAKPLAPFRKKTSNPSADTLYTLKVTTPQQCNPSIFKKATDRIRTKVVQNYTLTHF